MLGVDEAINQEWKRHYLEMKSQRDSIAKSGILKWELEDPRMLREQIRVGDVAFQHLLCTSQGQPMPDWVKAGLPNMYTLLEEISRLKAELQGLTAPRGQSQTS